MKRLEIAIETESHAWRRYAVPVGGLRLGRSSSNDLPVRDEMLSRNHCMFEQEGECGIRVIDLSSANGTFVNGRRLGNEPASLRAGDGIRVGGTLLKVMGDESSAAGVDLGLGGAGGEPPEASGEASPGGGSSRRFLLWSVAILALAAAGALMAVRYLKPEPAPRTEPVQVAPKPVEEMSYERVIGDSESVYRFWMRYDGEGMLSVQIDDLSGEGRHVSRSERLGERALKRLSEALRDEGLEALKEPVQEGPDMEPPRLDLWDIRYRTAAGSREFRIVNLPEPEAVRRVAERLNAFVENELGLRGMQYTREQLVKMATEAADTARMKWEDREVEYRNLDDSIRKYREAMACLETLNPKPPEYDEYRRALERSRAELDRRFSEHDFAAQQACSVEDWERARDELQILRDLVPDRDDERNRRASAKLIDVEKRLQRGVRR